MLTGKDNTMKYHLMLITAFMLTGCSGTEHKKSAKNDGNLYFTSSNKELESAFDWAKNKALSYAHNESDPVGFWYEAALPNREAFCMRDVSHQTIGAEILGLSRHNHNMFIKFAQNISKNRDYCSYWEINRYNEPAPIDYENDTDFWYNLPANFDVVYNAYRLYRWTGNKDYLENEDLQNFYELSMNQYVDHWDLGSNQVLHRNRSMHLAKDLSNTRFGNKRGIPTYNEGGRGETLLGIDMTASLIAAYKAYYEILELTGESVKAAEIRTKMEREQAFLDDFWWDDEKEAYRSIWYEDDTFDYFMVGENQAFLHYLIYFDVVTDVEKLEQIVSDYDTNFVKLIVELKSYLPIIFYGNNYTKKANRMIIDLCSEENLRRDYPENSFTVIEHLTRGLMGVEPDAASNTFSTLSRLENKNDWTEIKNVPLLANKVTVRHDGRGQTTATNESGPLVKWSARIPGLHEYLFVNGKKTKSILEKGTPNRYSYCTIELNQGEKATVALAL